MIYLSLRKLFTLTSFFAIIVSTDAGLLRSQDESINEACQKVVSNLQGKQLEGIKNIAVLPLWGVDDDGYVTETLKSHLANSKYSLVVRTDEEWKGLLDEMEWNLKREDIMDAETIQGFGRIKGCDAIMYGTVRQKELNAWKFQYTTRMTVNLADVETGQIVWSSKPATATVWLEWPEVLQLAVSNPLVLIIAAALFVFLVLLVIKGIIKSATRPR